MRCPSCSAEVSPLSISCNACGIGTPWLVTQPLGTQLLVGWGTTILVIWGMIAWFLHQEWSPWSGLGALGLYVLIANLYTPAVDQDNMGIGRTFINNPFTLEDNHNRRQLHLAFWLFPGKMVWWTLKLTWDAVGRLG